MQNQHDAMLPVVSGVYMLFKAQRLVYVGRSVNAYQRVAQHRTNGREFDYALVTPCPEADAPWVERAMIAAMEPPANRAGKPSGDARPSGRVVLHEIVKLEPSDDPMMTLNLGKAAEYAGKYGLATAFREAVKSGEIKMFPKDPIRTTPGAVMLITVGDLRGWCVRKNAERAAAAS